MTPSTLRAPFRLQLSALRSLGTAEEARIAALVRQTAGRNAWRWRLRGEGGGGHRVGTKDPGRFMACTVRRPHP